MIKTILFFTFFSFIFLGQAAQEGVVVVEKASSYRLQTRGGGGFECPEEKKKIKKLLKVKKTGSSNKRQCKKSMSKKSRSHEGSIGEHKKGSHGKGKGGR